MKNIRSFIEIPSKKEVRVSLITRFFLNIYSKLSFCNGDCHNYWGWNTQRKINFNHFWHVQIPPPPPVEQEQAVGRPRRFRAAVRLPAWSPPRGWWRWWGESRRGPASWWGPVRGTWSAGGSRTRGRGAAGGWGAWGPAGRERGWGSWMPGWCRNVPAPSPCLSNAPPATSPAQCRWWAARGENVARSGCSPEDTKCWYVVIFTTIPCHLYSPEMESLPAGWTSLIAAWCRGMRWWRRRQRPGCFSPSSPWWGVRTLWSGDGELCCKLGDCFWWQTRRFSSWLSVRSLFPRGRGSVVSGSHCGSVRNIPACCPEFCNLPTSSAWGTEIWSWTWSSPVPAPGGVPPSGWSWHCGLGPRGGGQPTESSSPSCSERVLMESFYQVLIWILIVLCCQLLISG